MEALHLCFVILLAAISTVTGDEQFRSDYEYRDDAQGWFKLHRTSSLWWLAELQCYSEGSVLASPLNEDIKCVMNSIISENTEVTARGVHTGIHNRHHNALYTSIEGVPLSEMPVDSTGLSLNEFVTSTYCMRMDHNNRVYVASCIEELPYICYKKKASEIEQPLCSAVDKEYHFDSRTQHCYKFHYYAANWTFAYMRCVTEGGHLAIINSDQEANVLKELYAKHPAASIVGADNNDVVNIGYLDWYRTGIWRTIHGQSLLDAGYAVWGPGKPDRLFYKGEHPTCGSMSRNGKLDDNYCGLPSAYICEKVPEHEY